MAELYDVHDVLRITWRDPTDTIMFLLFTLASLCAMVYLVHDFDGVPAIIEGLVAIDEKRN